MGVFSVEATEECDKVLAGRNFYVKTDGKIAHSLNTDTVKYLMKALVTTPNISQELYQEKEGSAFTHHRTVYDLNEVLRFIESRDVPVQKIPVKDLAWVLEFDTPDPQRMSSVDLSAPIIVVQEGERLTVIDGLHRLGKAVKIQQYALPGYIVQQHQLRNSRLGLAKDLIKS